MRGLRRTAKFKTDKPSNQNRKGKPLNRKACGRERGSHLRGETFGGRKEEQRAEYQNRKERMETGATEGESWEAKAKRRTEETTAGGDREAGKSKGRKLSSQKGTVVDERKRRGTEKADRKGTQGSGGRQAPGKRLRERNWEGRKETSRKAKY